jgi:hypothetical protein
VVRRLSTSLFLSAAAILLLSVDCPAARGKCATGLVPVYWLESSGLEDEPWRDTYVFEADLEPPNLSLVLHYDPLKDRAEWLDGHMSGTNVQIFGLVPLSGHSFSEALPFRWVRIMGDEGAPKAARGGPATVLIVDMKIYWPVCARAETVETWKKMAGPPGPAEDIYSPSGKSDRPSTGG